MATTIKANACLTLSIGESDNAVEYRIHEGDIVKGLKYKRGDNEYSVTGAVRVINAAAKVSNFTQSCPPESYFSKIVQINSVVIDRSTEFDADLITISATEIVGIDSVVDPETAEDEKEGTIITGVGPQYQSIDTLIGSVEEGSTVKVLAGDYTPALNIDKSLKIVGPNDVPQNAVVSALATETPTTATAAVMSGAITVNNGNADVELRGLTFTKDAFLNILQAKSVKLINCRIEGLVPNAAKSYPVRVSHTTGSVLVTIEGCFFGDNPTNGSNQSYNLIELQTTLETGSSISNNSFSGTCCTHNQINIYGVVEGATININNNYAVKSANMIRIGTKGSPTCVINCNGNSYGETDTSNGGEWAGLLLVQPYNNETPTFANMTININNTVHADEYQLAYLYCGASDTKITEELAPKVYVNGEVYNIPIIDETGV